MLRVDEAPAQVLVLATLGAPERRRLLSRRRHDAPPRPEPTPVTTSRVTVVDVGAPLADEREAQAWLRHAGDDELSADLAVLNRALHAQRLVSADPYARSVSRGQALVARVGFGAGEQVADGQWTAARELLPKPGRRGRLKGLQPQARLAAILSGREEALVCEELALRARLDLDEGREREAALQLVIALDAALAELPAEEVVVDRLAELRGRRDPVAAAAQAALAGPLSAEEREAVALTLARIEAALRARR